MIPRNVLVQTIVPILAVVFLANGVPARATARADRLDRVVMLIRDSRDAFRVTTKVDVAAARSETRRKMMVLNKVFNSGGANGRAWREYLLLDQLAAQLEREANADPEKLLGILERFRGDYPGLERSETMQLRAALQRYYHRAVACGDETLREKFLRRLDQLEELVGMLPDGVIPVADDFLRRESDQREDGLRRAAFHPEKSNRLKYNGESLQKINAHLAWLRQQEQVPAVVKAVRHLAPAVNVRLTVSEELLDSVIPDRVDRLEPLKDCILGTTVRGTSHLVGDMTVVPVPCQRSVQLGVRLQGEADTTGWGYHGPVQMRVVGTAAVEATGDVLFGPEGFRRGDIRAYVSATGRPTAMWTTYRSRIANGLVTHIARRRAARTRRTANYIASRNAEQRLKQQVDEELQTHLDVLQDIYLERFRKPLLRRQTFPRVFRATSQAQRVQLDMLLGTDTQTGAPDPPPVPESEAALSVQIHATAINNLADSVLAGRTIGQSELREFVRYLFTGESEAPAIEQEDQFQIVLADERPVTFDADDSRIMVKIRTKRFVTSRTKYPPMNLTIRYRPRWAEEAGLPWLSELEVLPPGFHKQGRRRMSAREIAARRFISRVLERELESDNRPGTITFPDLTTTLDDLVVTQLSADDGWLTIGAGRQ
ncbi:MAG: hypothetical protein ACQESR_31395 [Planctomycetota bacterium]